VCGRGQIYFVKYLLAKQDHLYELITISSVSQWKPRQLEPVYNFVKAGQSHLSNGLAEDGRIDKVLVVSPAGMDTPFWRDQLARDTSEFLDRRWVAEQTLNLLEGDYKFKLAKLERNPARVEIMESR
jgi:NAD(P)-dependent dehydrogenase (short-subunit alcohol dehydrogenase family)